jgi:hypothetical protein
MRPNVTYEYVVVLAFLVASVPSVEPNMVVAIIHLLSIISDLLVCGLREEVTTILSFEGWVLNHDFMQACVTVRPLSFGAPTTTRNLSP